MGFTWQNTIERFISFITQTTDEECWLWKGSVEKNGYGRVTYQGRRMRPHRFMLELMLGKKIPKDKVVMHTCDNRLCCNPKHLKVGTHKDNSEDMVSKNRQYRPQGSKNVYAKLDEAAARRIKWNIDCETSSYWAKVYNVKPITIRRIWNNETWKHI